MSEWAIEAVGVGKRYRIGVREAQHDTLGRAALAWVQAPLTNLRALRRLSRFDDPAAGDVLWALQDVSFTVAEGEALGIIGANGAGKSTLLKLLARITPPSAGRVTLNGRVASLLEVGTGFHPDLTGRENVYLNGAILGMTRAEIDHKFDEIVAFAEVAPFIDTPVKRYSSGMRVRLAFAVAAHLDPEILLIDEVLAVGDAAFQQKCLEKMDGVAQTGRTVLFVSHNMQAVQRLCARSLLLAQGRLAHSGPSAQVIEAYLQRAFSAPQSGPQTFNDQVRLNGIQARQNGRETQELFDNSLALRVHVDYELLTPLRNLLLGFDLYAGDGSHICRSYDLATAGMGLRARGRYESVLELPAGLLQPDFYYLELLLAVHRHGWLSRGQVRLKLQGGGARATDVDYPGAIGPLGEWEVRRIGEWGLGIGD